MTDAEQVEADIEGMRRAANQDFPDKAEELGTIAASLSDIGSVLNTQSALCSDPPSMVDLLTMQDLLFEAVRSCVLTMNDCSVALVAVVDDLVASDTVAADAMGRLKEDVPYLKLDGPAIQAPVPPPMEDTSEYGAPGVEPR